MEKTKWKQALVLLMVGIMLFQGMKEARKQDTAFLSYPEFWQMAEQGKIIRVEMGNGENWHALCEDGTHVVTPNPRADDGKERLLALGIHVKETAAAVSGNMLLIAAGMLAVMALFRSGGNNAMGLQKFAAVQADRHIPGITFNDVAASPEILQNMRDLVDFLKEPEIFRQYGARVPRGVMLYGPPGTGKTLLAKALAGEAKAPFFAMSGADFVQVYVGVGASRVRELFKKARKAGGGVIFIDEIDAVGKKRDSANDEREQTLNALLTEMSGFSDADGIIVLAATNRLDTLDAALLREGRFDRRIEVGLPDARERLKILEVHARKKPLHPEVSLEDWAKRTTLFSGAQLETLLNEAAIRTARKKAPAIRQQDLEAAYCAVTVGEDSPRLLSEEEKRIASFHEAGHALITRKMLPDARLLRLSIIPSSRGAAGYSMSIQKDRMFHSRKELMGMLCAAYGGRAAEEIIFGHEEITTGASGDLKKIREIASAMAEEWGMGEKREEIEKEAKEKTCACLRENLKTLEALAAELYLKETLSETEIQQLIG